VEWYLSACELLAVWDGCLNRCYADRALALLAAALPEVPIEELVALPVGSRDSLLLALRERLFGEKLNCRIDCPDCQEALELAFETKDIRVTPIPDPTHSNKHLELEWEGYQVRYRLPNGFDPQHLRHEDGPADRQVALLYRCLLGAKRKGKSMICSRLPNRVLEVVADAMAEADPQADTRISLICPACARQWSALFDILSYFWQEIHAWAQRLLAEVHLLAIHYHWSEDQILGLSPERRRHYLGMVRS